jgi:hypothetical protein
LRRPKLPNNKVVAPEEEEEEEEEEDVMFVNKIDWHLLYEDCAYSFVNILYT